MSNLTGRWVRATVAAAAWASAVASCTGAPPSPPPAPQPTAAPVEGSTGPQPSAAWSAAPPASAAASAAPEPPAPAMGEEAVKLPAGFVALNDEGETRCGELRVQVQRESPTSHERYVRVLGPGDKRVYEAHGRRYKVDEQQSMRMDLWADFCGDLTGDGVPELLLTERTMGAHCCYTHYVASMTSPSKLLLMWEKGDAGTPVLPVKLRPGDAWQLQGQVVMWPPFKGDAGDPVIGGYAGAPLVPVVFSLSGGEYKLTSLSFPEVYRKGRAAIYEACARNKDDCYGQIDAWIASIAIGDWEREKKNPFYDDLRPALDRRAAAMRQMLLSTAGSQQRPAPTRAK